MTFQKVVKSRQQKFSPQRVKMSSTSYTSLSDHYNSISSSRGVIHSEPSQLHSFLCPHFWARCLMLATYRYWLSVI